MFRFASLLQVAVVGLTAIRVVAESGAVPPIPSSLRIGVAPFFEPGMQRFHGWHPAGRGILVSAPDVNATQIFVVDRPMGSARQLTFGSEPVGNAAYLPETGRHILFLKDIAGLGGQQMFRIYSDSQKPVPVLLSDPKRTYYYARWAPNGQQIAYLVDLPDSRERELGVLNPLAPLTARRLVKLPGIDWTIEDWASNSAMLLLREVVSDSESYLHLADAGTGVLSAITPRSPRKVRYGMARFSPSFDAVYYTSDVDSDFMQLCRLDLRTGIHKVLLSSQKWDMEALEISPNGKQAALVINEAGFSQLRLLDLKALKLQPIPNLSRGRVHDLHWHTNGTELGFSVSAADSAGDVFSWDILGSRLKRWTWRVRAAHGSPGVGAVRSFDDEIISLVYWLPDAQRFPKPSRRPVLLKLSSTPDGQMRPGHLSVQSYLLEKLGVAIVCPNLRGADGYGNRHRQLDNGILRAHTLADLNAVLNWIRQQPQMDGERVALWGEGYGGSLTLLAMSNFNSFVRCGVVVDPVVNWVDYLRGARVDQKDRLREEFGDERKVEVREFLDRFSPLDAAGKNLGSIPLTSPVLLMGEIGPLGKALREKKKTAWVLPDTPSINKKRVREENRALAGVLFLKQKLLSQTKD